MPDKFPSLNDLHAYTCPVPGIIAFHMLEKTTSIDISGHLLCAHLYFRKNFMNPSISISGFYPPLPCPSSLADAKRPVGAMTCVQSWQPEVTCLSAAAPAPELCKILEV